ncbi:restriction endonuclease subunit S [Trabulsiella odontotermitis]|uniref:restriction endonuclease subunit S n=1 Tax=Trabulsiella odontotermitis TaxID=379893 RepID=UPI003AC6DBAC
MIDSNLVGFVEKDFCSVVKDVTSGNPKVASKDYLMEGRYPIIDQGSNFCSGYTDSKELLCNIELPCIIFGDHTRVLKYVDTPFALGADGIKVLKPIKGLSEKYLFYFLKNLDIPSAGYSRHFKFLKEKNIKYPLQLSEQKRIIAILDKADGIRQKREKAIKLVDDFLHATFLEMFGDPVSNPKGWKVKPLKELSVKIASGSTPKGGSKVYVDKGITFFRSQNVWKNDIRLDDVAYIDEKTHNILKKSSLKHKDILMTKTGRFNTENSSLGRAALFLGEDNSANVNGHVYLIRLKPGMLHEFIVYILTSNEYREHIREVCVGGIDKRQLNKEHIEDFPIICPPDDLQMEFMRKLNSIQKIHSNAMTGLKEVIPLFNTLNQKAFSDGF